MTGRRSDQHGRLRAKLYKGRTTSYVIVACIVAACGGLIFGYDVGISGGATSMPAFLQEFGFSNRLDRQDQYCQSEDRLPTTFRSAPYLAGIPASLLASHITKICGRRPSIIYGGLCSIIGAVLTGAARNLAVLILGRIMLGFGIGFSNRMINLSAQLLDSSIQLPEFMDWKQSSVCFLFFINFQAVPLYLSEMAPAKIRGALNIMFQLAITIGVLCGNLVNYTTQIPDWGWRLPLGLAGVPAILMSLGGFFLPETPNSLIEHGCYEEGRRLLTKIRGTEEVDAEYEDIKEASEVAMSVTSPHKALFQRKNRPQLVMATMIPFFQQVTGINAIMFYAPVLFRTVGFGSDASLYSAVITGAVNVVATLVAVALVDRLGRRFFFLQAGVQMFISQVVVAGIKFGGTEELDKAFTVIVVIIICGYGSAFAWSWGPLGWLVPSEIFPLETRSAGQGITVAVNLFFTIVFAQAFHGMLCWMRYGIFLFFAGWVLIMSLFIFFLLPETKSVPIEDMIIVWRRHWFWKRFVPD